MRVFIVAILVALVVYVSGESCSSTSDCTSTSCASPTHLVCSRFSHQCVCTQGGGSGGSCTTQDDCSGCIGHLHRHCVDGHCQCTIH